MANSSSGKIILIGVLHQAFNAYARKLFSIDKDEWIKVQGRFVDLHINSSNHEQLELISRALVSEKKPSIIRREACEIACSVKNNKQINEESYAKVLNDCWPLRSSCGFVIRSFLKNALWAESKKRFFIGKLSRTIWI